MATLFPTAHARPDWTCRLEPDGDFFRGWGQRGERGAGPYRTVLSLLIEALR